MQIKDNERRGKPNPSQVEMLISELVRPELVPLYLNNMIFHNSIERLAHSLPTWVDALAAQAQATETEQQQRYLDLLQAEVANLPR